MSTKLLASAITVLGLIALLFGPGKGEIALSPRSSEFVSRLSNRFLPSEAEELDKLACFEDSLSEIPDGSFLWIQTSDAYLAQRFSEVSFPRLSLVGEAKQYGVYANWQGNTQGTTIKDQGCGGVNVRVVSFG